MPLDPTADANLRAALQPFRVDPDPFEAAVRDRLRSLEANRLADPLAGASPFLRGAAAFLPLPVVTGGKISESVTPVVAVTGVWKLVSYLTFPAIGLFFLVGATLFSVVRIRGIQQLSPGLLDDEQAVAAATQLWWRRYRWGAWLVFAVLLGLMFNGATWLVFLFLILSFGIVVFVLGSLTRQGLADRQAIARSCLMGLALLGQVCGGFRLGDNEIHFVDQKLIGVVFFGGVLLILPLSWGRIPGVQAGRRQQITRVAASGVLVSLLIALGAWFLDPILRPATPERIKHHVESFDTARFSSVSWRNWALVARWAIDAGLNPDLTRPRRLLAESNPSDAVNPFILGSASRVGLIPADRVVKLPEYANRRKSLVDDSNHTGITFPITSLAQEEWVIRGSVLNESLTPAERDFLARRLDATMQDELASLDAGIPDVLLVTRLLAAIDRPVDRARYRPLIHNLLRKRHSRQGGGFQLAGGFRPYDNGTTGSAETTEEAIELMEIYGVPAGLDLNWVRSFVRPNALGFSDKWIIAVARERLNRLPGVAPPTWAEMITAERSLIAAVVLVGLCLYATLATPRGRGQVKS